MRHMETDYLVIGAGATGMSFVDALLEVSDADVVLVDRRDAPGGHWNDAYGFVRLHQATQVYGVDSTPIAEPRIDTEGLNRGLYARATGAEVSGYYDRVLEERLLASGRVRWLPRTDHLGGGRLRSLVTGDELQVDVRRRFVDATYLVGAVPATSPRGFEIGPGARVAIPNDLVDLADQPDRFVVIGAGKTAMDTCTWLLERGVPADAIQSIRPRDVWMVDRLHLQPAEFAHLAVAGFADHLEALAEAGSADDAFLHLERTGVMHRLDPEVLPGFCRGATYAAAEADLLRTVTDVVRRGRVRRVEVDRIVLDDGTVPTTAGSLHVDCTATGVAQCPRTPIFGPGTITPQAITRASIPLAGGLIARVEAMEIGDDERNRLLPPMESLDRPLAYFAMIVGGMMAEFSWRQVPEILQWFHTSRLNMTRRTEDGAEHPELRAARDRLKAAAGPALEGWARLSATSGN